MGSQCVQEINGARKLRFGRAGCTFVGTSKGRIIQLKSGRAGANRTLIPDRMLHQRVEHTSSRGSLSVLPNSVVLALWAEPGGTSSVSAFDARRGINIGEWMLPTDTSTKWLMLTGSDDAIYVLGVRGIKKREVLY